MRLCTDISSIANIFNNHINLLELKRLNGMTQTEQQNIAKKKLKYIKISPK